MHFSLKAYCNCLCVLCYKCATRVLLKNSISMNMMKFNTAHLDLQNNASVLSSVITAWNFFVCLFSFVLLLIVFLFVWFPVQRYKQCRPTSSKQSLIFKKCSHCLNFFFVLFSFVVVVNYCCCCCFFLYKDISNVGLCHLQNNASIFKQFCIFPYKNRSNLL